LTRTTQTDTKPCYINSKEPTCETG